MNKQKPTKEWFNNRCKAARAKLRLISKNLSKDPFNKTTRDKFVKARGEYKKQCRRAEKEQRGFLTKKLINIAEDDPKMFWALIGKMNKWGKEKLIHLIT